MARKEKVVRVIDGDTFKMASGKAVRLADVDGESPVPVFSLDV